MSIKDTYKQMRELLADVISDLEKSENGNKAASQRVRTGTVKLEKIAKLFRKESIAHEKKTKGQKKPSRAASSAKKTANKGSGASSSGKSKSGSTSKSKGTSVKAKPKAKSAQAKTSVRSRQLSLKRATAKLPTRRVSAS